MRILIVEDDEFTAKALTAVLSSQHYAVEVATDGQASWELVEAFAYDLILLDVMLPKLDGISLCRRLRSQGYQMPILLLTGRDSTHDKAIGLDAGADDYVVKPFDQEELVARIRALLRRGSSSSSPILEWGSLQLDPSSCEVTYGTRPLHLTPKEYSLLELFLRNSRRVFSCGAILDHLWSFDKTPGEEAVRTQIKGLRQKLKAAGAPADLIETVYGIGYRLKPLEATTVLTASPETGERTTQQTLFALAGIWERYKERISEQIAVLDQAAAALLKKTLGAQLRQQAYQEAHTLAGSLGTFGFTEGSLLARKIERLFQAGKSLDKNEAIRLRELVEALHREIELTPEGLAATAKTKDERPLLLIVDSDRQLAKKLVMEASGWGIRAEVATLSAARDAITYKHPNVVLLDLDLSHTTEDGLKLLAELSNRTPPVPVLVFTAQDNLTTRLEVARAGGRTFLKKPVAEATVLQTVTQMLQHVKPAVARVMVVDDDPQILATLRTLLEPWGLAVITLDDPRRFWETLEASSPQLLILDINMPHVRGIELCQIVRNDARWSGLPVLFLTAYTDATIVNQVFAAGADDFVSKPIVGPELVNRIINRLERIKLLRSLAQTDPLTGVSNHHQSSQDLDKFLRLAKRHNQPLCLAILDLDRFKQVNDRYGHATGDAVLRQIGQLLMRSFHSEDVVARWGGEEFVVGMYGMTKSDAVQRLTKVLETLDQEEFLTPTHPKLQVTFSAGVAQYPEDGADLESLYRSCVAALYQAKATGRDRMLPVRGLKPEQKFTKH
jgi:diguanylate cyclase (GGDEF)-like protein